MLNNIVSIITLIAGLCSAITIISSFFGRPIVFWTRRAKEKRQAVEEREKKELVNSLSSAVEPQLTEIRRINEEQSHIIKLIQESQLNLLRQAILNIYHAGKATHTITESDKELLEDLYASYTNLGGNHYISRKYDRMQHWEVISDDCDQHLNND